MHVEELAFNEGVRRIEQQEETLRSLHTRAAVLFSATAIATAFFARLVDEVKGGRSLGRGTALAIALALVGFVAVFISALVILLPRKWKFGRNPKKILKHYMFDPTNPGNRWDEDDIYHQLARHLEDDHADNKKKLDRMFGWLAAGLAFLGFEVVMWLLSTV